jgi:hypothetical protein
MDALYTGPTSYQSGVTNVDALYSHQMLTECLQKKNYFYLAAGGLTG